MNKSPDAFRTISEVAEFLETPAHVLRFWESRFPQIRPVKRAGGRRYYRPSDVALLTGIKRLLHDEGMTIRGVQKILREQGVRHVSGVADDGDDDTDADDLAAALAQATGGTEPEAILPPAEAETAQVIALQAALRSPGADAAPRDVAAEPERAPEEGVVVPWQDDPAPEEGLDETQPEDSAPDVTPPPAPVVALRPAPVVADLFSQVPPLPAPAPPDPVVEAPMAVWAEEPEPDAPASADEGESARPSPLLKITRIGGAATPPPLPPRVPPAPPVASPEPALAGPTLAQRLRAVSPDALTEPERQQLAALRDRANALRRRLAGPNRFPA
ncbi:MerR family transcriptional regulator [Pseudotabrizicola algicola]|uniref:MerR family transcriptional regulator n=1 Tax=Pseudotabrizicola algicola TaxID=2709381 RepID=UPI001F077255|nr:MerR family transcriptional regulator [Pseudotabrizicola algicola]